MRQICKFWLSRMSTSYHSAKREHFGKTEEYLETPLASSSFPVPWRFAVWSRHQQHPCPWECCLSAPSPDLPNQSPRLPGPGSSPGRPCLSASPFFQVCSPCPPRRSSLTMWKSPSTHTPASPSHRSCPSQSQFITCSSHWTVTFFQAGSEQPQDLRQRPGYWVWSIF